MSNDVIKIRPLDLSDKTTLASLANNKNIWDNLRDYIPYPYTESDAIFFINSTKQEEPQQSFGIVFNNNICGVISLVIQKDVYHKSAEIGYWIGEPYWGKGIATQAVKLITEYGFNELTLNRIYAGIFEYNLASIEVLKKNGFEREGIFKKAIIKNNKVYDEHRFYKLNNY